VNDEGRATDAKLSQRDLYKVAEKEIADKESKGDNRGRTGVTRT